MPGLRVWNTLPTQAKELHVLAVAKVALLVCTDKAAMLMETDKNELKILRLLLNSSGQCPTLTQTMHMLKDKALRGTLFMSLLLF